MGLQDRDWFKEGQDQRANCASNVLGSSKQARSELARTGPRGFSGFFVFYISVLSFFTGFTLAYLCRHEINLLLAMYGIHL